MGAQGGSPGDIADAIAFLCSTEAKFVNGIVLPVDGGWAASKGYTTGSGAAQFTSAKTRPNNPLANMQAAVNLQRLTCDEACATAA